MKSSTLFKRYRFYIFIIAVLLTSTSCSNDHDDTNTTNSGKGLTVIKTGDIKAFTDVISPFVLLLPQLTDTTSEYYKIYESCQQNWSETTYYNVEYPSKDASGNSITVSGRIYLRKQDMENKKVKGIILYNHYTITSEEECPSEDSQHLISLFTKNGYAVIMPDYVGFGTTKNLPQTYLHQASTACQCVDMLLCTRLWLNSRGIVNENADYNIGYSQGGAVSIAVEKYVEQYYPNSIRFKTTFAGGGPYAIYDTYKDIIASGITSYPVEIPLMIIGMNCAYNMNLDYTKVFKGLLLSKYEEWVLSKKYTTTYINTAMGTTSISDMIQPEFLDTTSTQNIKFIQALKENSLISGWTFTGTSPILLFHSTDDVIVPSFNTDKMYDKLKNDGYTNANLTLIKSSMGAHTQAGIYFFIKCYSLIE
jgi:hypothetical protein